MKRRIATVLAVALTAAGLLVQAQAMTDGEVRRVDPAQRKITLKHGEIKHLDLPAMSMAFAVRDPALLARVQPGDKVRFSAARVDGTYTVTAIEVMKK